MLRLDVEVVEHFHVIGDEADGCDHDGTGEILILYFVQMVEDVGFELRLSGRAAVVLVDEYVVLDTDSGRREPSYFFELFHVVG